MAACDGVVAIVESRSTRVLLRGSACWMSLSLECVLTVCWRVRSTRNAVGDALVRKGNAAASRRNNLRRCNEEECERTMSTFLEIV